MKVINNDGMLFDGLKIVLYYECLELVDLVL